MKKSKKYTAEEKLVMARALLADAEKRIACLVKYYDEEAELEDVITLDDGALASAWKEQHQEFIAMLNGVGEYPVPLTSLEGITS